MPAPPGFGDLIQRKYDIMQQQADSEGQLRDAQAKGITGSLDSENALRGAQAFATRQQGQTYAPLASASVASTIAGIGTQNAQTRLLGTENAVQGFNGLATPGEIGAGLLYDQHPGLGGGGRGALNLTPQTGSLGGGSSLTNTTRTLGSPGVTTTRIVNPSNDLYPEDYGVQNHAKGTSRVKASAGRAGGKGQMMGSNAAAPDPQGAMAAPAQMGQMMPGGGVSPPPNLPGLAALLHAAIGMTTVPQPQPAPAPAGPAPGQTVTSGNWGTGGQNQDLRAKMGYGQQPKAYAGGGVVPGKRPPVGAVQDRVPAMLTPGEAVLTPGAADKMGRGRITAMNAKHPPAGPAMAGDPMPRKGPPSMNRGMVKKGHQVNIHVKMGGK